MHWWLHSVVFRTKLLTFPRFLLTLVTRDLKAHFLRNAEDSAGLTKQIRPFLFVQVAVVFFYTLLGSRGSRFYCYVVIVPALLRNRWRILRVSWAALEELLSGSQVGHEPSFRRQSQDGLAAFHAILRACCPETIPLYSSRWSKL